jgi:glycosyltransferase involved in cell wall biosynthesis
VRRTLDFVVPGRLDQRTGGYIYDRKIVDGLRAAGWPVVVHELAGRFPDADNEARDAAAAAIHAMDGGVPIIDGLALPAFDELVDRLPRPWIGLIHHPLCMETGLDQTEATRFAKIEGPLMRAADGLIVTSPGTRRDLGSFDIDPGRVAVVVPGVERAPLAAGLGRKTPASLLCVATLTRRKGHLVLLHALAGLLDLDWRLTIVGGDHWDQEHAERIRAMIREKGLSARVAMIGEQDEAALAGFYDRADLFVLASHHEGYGMVLVEALAHGLPIVSTTAGAIPETVPAAAGRLVPPGDAEALADALRDVLTQRRLYEKLKEGAFDARESLCDWTEAARRFATAIDEALMPVNQA